MKRHKNSRPLFPSFSILIIFLVACLIGIFLIPNISVQLFPDQKQSILKVSCYIPDVSPEVTDGELTSLLEDALASLKGIRNLYSVSGKGHSVLTIELDKFVNIDNFRLEASELLRQLYPKLPKGASYPELFLNNSGLNEGSEKSILAYNLSGPGDYNDVLEFARKKIAANISKIKGIKEFAIDGDKSKEIVISPDLKKMESFNLTLIEFERAIRSGMETRDLGLVITNVGKVNVQIKGQLKERNDLYNFQIKTPGGRIVSLQDISDIKTADVPKNYYYRINGNDVISLKFYPADQVNAIELASQIKEVMTYVQTTLPKNYKLGLTYDNTQIIRDELRNIYYRTFLSIIILLAFVFVMTNEWRYLIVVISSLSCNVLISIIFYYLFDLDIHLYSLAGITISLGMVVDNVIILISELKDRNMGRIFPAILASTATALGALSVVYMINGNVKTDLTDFVTAILINLIVSLPISYFFIPAILERLPTNTRVVNYIKDNKLKMAWFENFYRKKIIFMLNFRKLFLMFFLLCFGLPFFLLPQKIEAKNFLSTGYNATLGSDYYNTKLRPTINKYFGGILFFYFYNTADSSPKYSNDSRTIINMEITMPNGSSLQQMNEICKDFEKYLRQFQDHLDICILRIESANKAQISILFKEENIDEEYPFYVKQLLENKATLAGAADFAIYGLGRGFNNETNLDEYDSSIQLKGYSYSDLNHYAIMIKDSLQINPRVENVLITTANRWEPTPIKEFVVNFTDPAYLEVYGLNKWDLSKSLMRFDQKSSVLGEVRIDEKNYLPVTIRKDELHLTESWVLKNSHIPINDSTSVSLGDVSNISQIKVGDNILKENQSYLLNVHYKFVGSRDQNKAVKVKIVSNLEKILPFGYGISSNENEIWYNINSGSNYILGIALVLVIIYIICAILLESLYKPLIVVVTIPFSFIGVFLAFYFFNLKFDNGGYACLLLLAGIVTNAALYIINDLVFFSNRKEPRNGISLELYYRAFNAKIRPILITTASAILSMIPFLIIGDEKGFWFTLSIGTIGGLIFSILSVYIVLPICLIERLQKK